MAIELVGGEQSKPLSIFICLFTYGGIEAKTMQCIQDELEKIQQTVGAKAVLFNVHGDALISRSRSKALSVFLESKHDVCFMVDHDIEWVPGALLQTAVRAAARQCLVGGLYPCRGIGRGLATRMKSNMTKFKTGDDLLLDAEYLATGFIAIPRVVAEEVLKYGLAVDPRGEAEANVTGEAYERALSSQLHHCLYNDGTAFFDFFRPICVKRTVQAVSARLDLPPYEYLSEDWAFCYRARAANANRPIYAWTAPWLVHHGSYGYTLFDAYKAQP